MRADGCVIFIHLPKTGGRTLAAALRYKYPSRTLCLDSLYEPLERIEEVPLEHRRAARAITGHLHYGVHRHVPQRCDYITMLRDPVARVVSMYRFIRGNPKNWLHDEVVGSGMGLEEFVLRAPDPTAENLQTRLLSGLGPGKVMALGADGRLRAPDQPPPPVTEDDLARAKRNLDRFLVIGLTERFDESFILIRRALGWRLPMYERQNVSKAGLREPPTPEAIELIHERNRFDLSLYEHAAKLFAYAVESQSPSFRREVAAFRVLNRIPNAIGPRMPTRWRHSLRPILPR
jgi:Galactose-3-O-sulfotransferase